MKLGIVGIAVLGVAVVAATRAPAQQSFEDWLKQDQEALQQYNAETTRQFKEFVERDRKAFEEFVRQAGAKWGRQNVWVPEVKSWVNYTAELDERSAVDFEKGVARVQVLIDTEQDVSPADVAAAVEVAVQRAVLSGTVGPVERVAQQLYGGSDAGRDSTVSRRKIDEIKDFSSHKVATGDTVWGLSRRYDIVEPDLAKLNRMEVESPLSLGRKMLVPYVEPGRRLARVAGAGAPLLDRQVRGADGQPVTPGNAAEFARSVVAAQTPKVTAVNREDGKKVKSATVEFKLAPDHIKVRAERYLPLVEQYAAKYSLDPALVFALMHTESAFNPRARSAVPAYGLMQLVPSSGGRDAYRAVYNEDKLVTGNYLYEPRNNIELGTAFVHLIGTRYLKAVTNPRSRMYCTIAAYNTGAGNVCKAFGNTMSVARVAPAINALTPDEVFERLKTRLPYEETRNYVIRVNERMTLYR